MRYLILFLSFNLFAMTNYVPEDKSYGAFALKEACEKMTNKTCYPFNVKTDNPEIMIVQDVNVNDLEKPIYAKATNETPCKIYPVYAEEGKEPNLDDCRLLIRSENIGTEENPDYINPLCDDRSYYALYAEVTKDVYNAYCTKLLGYEQKIEKQLLEDAALKAAKEQEAATKAAFEAAKKSAIDQAKADIQNARGKVGTMNNAAKDALIENILTVIGMQ